MKVIIITAADASYFYLVQGLLLSIHERKPNLNIQIAVLDVGLTSEQRQNLERLVNIILSPDWDFNFPGQKQAPRWFKAMTARPFLPKYFPGFDIYVWIDADAWLQSWNAIELLIETAKDGDLAIIEESFGKGLFIQYLNQNHQEAIFSITPEDIQQNITSCYAMCYGEYIAANYGKLPPINSGVFAMRRDVPYWQIWSAYLKQGLQRSVHKLIEQQALNIAIRRSEISVRFLPEWCNWLLIHKLPLFEPESCKFVLPENPSQTIGILHLANLKRFSTLTVPTVAGEMVNLPLNYLGLQDWQKNK